MFVAVILSKSNLVRARWTNGCGTARMCVDAKWSNGNRQLWRWAYKCTWALKKGDWCSAIHSTLCRKCWPLRCRALVKSNGKDFSWTSVLTRYAHFDDVNILDSSSRKTAESKTNTVQRKNDGKERNERNRRRIVWIDDFGLNQPHAT